LAETFSRSQSFIKDLLVEYILYLEALNLPWTTAEKEELLRPKLEFNPPVRFLQTVGHKEQVGIELDRINIKINFLDSDAKNKLMHLIRRTVIETNGPSATATYSEVFSNYVNTKVSPNQTKRKSGQDGSQSQSTANSSNGGDDANSDDVDADAATDTPVDNAKAEKNSALTTLKPNTLFAYDVSQQDLTLNQLMKEAKGLNVKKFPGAGTALLRGIVEVVLKLIIEKKNLNTNGNFLTLEGAVNLIINKACLQKDDLNIVKEFNKSHLNYLNLSTHATVVPNYNRLIMVRDCIDPFIKRNV
jgi:hypothetical protein